jgi:hypothetical protein
MTKCLADGLEAMGLCSHPRRKCIKAIPHRRRRQVLKAQSASVKSAWKGLIQFAVFACLALLARNCWTQTADKIANDKAITVLRQQIGLDNDAPNERNPKGLRIQFQKIEDVQLADGHSGRYRLLVPGAPEKQSYTLAVWRIGAEVKYTPGQVYTNAKGLMMWHLPSSDQEQKESLESADEVEVDLKAARGEPIRYMLASQDGKLFFPGTVVPYPVVSENGKCRLEARLGFPEAEGVLVYAQGLTPGGFVPLQTETEGETHNPTMTVDTKGNAVAIVAPYVAGKSKGVVKISVALPGCSLGVEVPWGEESYQAH